MQQQKETYIAHVAVPDDMVLLCAGQVANFASLGSLFFSLVICCAHLIIEALDGAIALQLARCVTEQSNRKSAQTP